jgi:hypothetical protein
MFSILIAIDLVELQPYKVKTFAFDLPCRFFLRGGAKSNEDFSSLMNLSTNPIKQKFGGIYRRYITERELFVDLPDITDTSR